MTFLIMTPFQFWGYIGVASVICYGLGLLTMRLLAMPKKPKPVKPSEKAALITVEYHRDNYPGDENIAI